MCAAALVLIGFRWPSLRASCRFPSAGDWFALGLVAAEAVVGDGKTAAGIEICRCLTVKEKASACEKRALRKSWREIASFMQRLSLRLCKL